ncbi:hypothetical protein [Pigmentiphaga sp.]|jgi:hypothetical protein|uniref:hypothetical protein n=1 Tax=Pigmentiphaga sp. TaxID=1977564 RepID=UPI0025EF0F5A|nr:hypothetical protein [Pigmentiphaga sp.]MBX6318732.1 hypothetical protein [Pigmentiphaga sp.]
MKPSSHPSDRRSSEGAEHKAPPGATPDVSAKREQISRQNDRNTSADELGRAPKSNKLSGSGIDVAGPGGK